MANIVVSAGLERRPWGVLWFRDLIMFITRFESCQIVEIS